MTSTPPPDLAPIAVLGTGLIGTSIAMAAARAGIEVTGWDRDPGTLARASAIGGFRPAEDLRNAVAGARVAVVCTPIGAVAGTVAEALAASPSVIVTDAGSIKTPILRAVEAVAGPDELARFVPGHPMGGSERSGPDHASAHVIDGIVWVLTPGDGTAPGSVDAVERLVGATGAQVVRMAPDRHDRLVAFVSHLPQVASSTLMGIAATEEADEPDLLLLAAGGFRDLTRLAASNPGLWSEILIANAAPIAAAIDLYVERLLALRSQIVEGRAGEVTAAFDDAKAARLRLAAKPQVRAGIAVWQIEIPDEPGALARITATVGAGGVNIEDLQIVHSPEGGRGSVHLTVAAAAAEDARSVLTSAGYDPIRLA